MLFNLSISYAIIWKRFSYSCRVWASCTRFASSALPFSAYSFKLRTPSSSCSICLPFSDRFALRKASSLAYLPLSPSSRSICSLRVRSVCSRTTLSLWLSCCAACSSCSCDCATCSCVVALDLSAVSVSICRSDSSYLLASSELYCWRCRSSSSFWVSP